MKRFRFRLEKLLEIRRYKEQQEEIRMAEAAGKCRRLSLSIQDKEEKERQQVLSRCLSKGKVDTEALVSAEMFGRRLHQEGLREKEELVQREQEREEVRKGYLEASREKKVLEKLREKKEEEYYAEQKRIEIHTMDEQTTAAAARRISKENEEIGEFHGK